MKTIEERFWSKVKGGSTTDCWEWLGAQAGGGYGDFFVKSTSGKRKKVPAHRWSYEHLREEIPPGMQLDHLCRNRLCVNPWHLEPVTHRENNKRGEKASRTHCPAGHVYSPENTYVAARGDRQCRTCMRERNYRNWKKLQAKAQSNQIPIRQARKVSTS